MPEKWSLKVRPSIGGTTSRGQFPQVVRYEEPGLNVELRAYLSP